ncbi:DsbA family protein [Patescibacteria group bacterium]|nr:DsbA family protein [Patescibacteria group bacterium]
MAVKKLEKNISPRPNTKEKTITYSSKLFVAISLISLVGFVIIVMFGVSIFRDSKVQTTESKSDFAFVERGVVANDLFVSINSYLPTVLETDPVRGNEDALVTIVEFGDYGCSHCASMQNTLARILVEYPDQVKIVWKDLPISSSANAAIAARCAQLQGKFWEMHDLLFKNSFFLNKGRFLDLAEDLGLQMEEFNSCIDLGTTAPLVQEGVDQAATLKIDGTPYYFINDQEISGSISYDDLNRFIQLEI